MTGTEPTQHNSLSRPVCTPAEEEVSKGSHQSAYLTTSTTDYLVLLFGKDCRLLVSTGILIRRTRLEMGSRQRESLMVCPKYCLIAIIAHRLIACNEIVGHFSRDIFLTPLFLWSFPDAQHSQR
jgi:hypothetical protein